MDVFQGVRRRARRVAQLRVDPTPGSLTSPAESPLTVPPGGHARSMTRPVTLWQQGDRWGDFAELLRAPVTIVTTSGATRLLDVAAGWTTRLPYSPIDRLPGDGQRVLITSVPVATACGLRIDGPGPLWTTEVALVLADRPPTGGPPVSTGRRCASGAREDIPRRPVAAGTVW